MHRKIKNVKIFIVDECFQCPNILSGKNLETGQMDHDCNLKDREIVNPYTLPLWCPLENYIKKEQLTIFLPKT